MLLEDGRMNDEMNMLGSCLDPTSNCARASGWDKRGGKKRSWQKVSDEASSSSSSGPSIQVQVERSDERWKEMRELLSSAQNARRCRLYGDDPPSNPDCRLPVVNRTCLIQMHTVRWRCIDTGSRTVRRRCRRCPHRRSGVGVGLLLLFVCEFLAASLSI